MQPVIIGAGLAGLTVALTLAAAGQPCILIARREAGAETSSGWAQGGIAAALGMDDSPALHAADTCAAGAGLCDPALVELITGQAPAVIAWLAGQGVPFDRTVTGAYALGLEGAHRRHRIVHVQGDSAGAAIVKTLVARVAASPLITVIDNTTVTSLLHDAQGISGIALLQHGQARMLATRQVVLATGGAGALWEQTTNPVASWGQGLALAARAGAVLRDLEFMQFHPTAIAVSASDGGWRPLPLASEALRGEGARLVNDHGEHLLASDLLARDIVTRAIWQQVQAGRQVYLDATMIADFTRHFPAIYAFCQAGGIDPQCEPIPVRPAAHYHMGGVATDREGRSSVTGLWACGEVAATGLHGANRLASNSLLEAVVMGQRVAQDIVRVTVSPLAAPDLVARSRQSEVNAPLIRNLMTCHVGVQRHATGLQQAIAQLQPLAAEDDRALVALMMATAALRRQESRGGHARTDFPATVPALAQPTLLTVGDVLPETAYSRRHDGFCRNR